MEKKQPLPALYRSRCAFCKRSDGELKPVYHKNINASLLYCSHCNENMAGVERSKRWSSNAYRRELFCKNIDKIKACLEQLLSLCETLSKESREICSCWEDHEVFRAFLELEGKEKTHDLIADFKGLKEELDLFFRFQKTPVAEEKVYVFFCRCRNWLSDVTHVSWEAKEGYDEMDCEEDKKDSEKTYQHLATLEKSFRASVREFYSLVHSDLEKEVLGLAREF